MEGLDLLPEGFLDTKFEDFQGFPWEAVSLGSGNSSGLDIFSTAVPSSAQLVGPLHTLSLSLKRARQVAIKRKETTYGLAGHPLTVVMVQRRRLQRTSLLILGHSSLRFCSPGCHKTTDFLMTTGWRTRCQT